MTYQGSAHGRFSRAIQTRNLWAAEMAMRELAPVSLLDALDYLGLLAAHPSDRFDRAAVRWHGRLEAEATTLTLAESQLRSRRSEPARSNLRTRFRKRRGRRRRRVVPPYLPRSAPNTLVSQATRLCRPVILRSSSGFATSRCVHEHGHRLAVRSEGGTGSCG